MNALASTCTWNLRLSWLGRDALENVCAGNTKTNMIWAWMLRVTYALGT